MTYICVKSPVEQDPAAHKSPTSQETIEPPTPKKENSVFRRKTRQLTLYKVSSWKQTEGL